MCATVTSSKNTGNSPHVDDRDFLHSISGLMLHKARLYEKQSKAFRPLLELKQDVESYLYINYLYSILY